MTPKRGWFLVASAQGDCVCIDASGHVWYSKYRCVICCPKCLLPSPADMDITASQHDRITISLYKSPYHNIATSLHHKPRPTPLHSTHADADAALDRQEKKKEEKKPRKDAPTAIRKGGGSRILPSALVHPPSIHPTDFLGTFHHITQVHFIGLLGHSTFDGWVHRTAHPLGW